MLSSLYILVHGESHRAVFLPGSTSVSVGQESTASADYVTKTGTKLTYLREVELSQTYI